MELDDIAAPLVDAEQLEIGRLILPLLNMLQDEVVLELARSAISELNVRVFGLPSPLEEGAAQEFARNTREIIRALERSATISTS